jgi:hypothetical protein
MSDRHNQPADAGADAGALGAFGLQRVGVERAGEPEGAQEVARPSLAEALYPHLIDNRERKGEQR